MLDDKVISLIEERLDEKVVAVKLVSETSPSYIFHITGKRQYILKQAKSGFLEDEFENHKRIYQLWLDNKNILDFVIPKPYFADRNKRFTLMEYIEGENLLRTLINNRDNLASLFQKTGLGLNQYHKLVTQSLTGTSGDISRYKDMDDMLSKKVCRKVHKYFTEFPEECYRILFRDFSPTNVIISADNKIYFIDIPDTFYFGPFYYDLSRFIDTTKVFGVIKNPLFISTGCSRIKRALDSFLKGYGDDINMDLLKKMQLIHRDEHVRFKKTITPLRAFILKVLYKVV